jgi:hypothetical protein
VFETPEWGLLLTLSSTSSIFLYPDRFECAKATVGRGAGALDVFLDFFLFELTLFDLWLSCVFFDLVDFADLTLAAESFEVDLLLSYFWKGRGLVFFGYVFKTFVSSVSYLILLSSPSIFS